jgi:hypothetical protein
MAELPKYRPLGVSIPSIPDVDFVSAGRAQGEVYRSLGKSLDVMVDYVYKRKVAQTKREAAKYAFENPVTAEQIQDAISQGRDIEEIVGDPDTIFGAVTTATAAQQLTTELQIEANKKISSYSAMIKAGQDIDISKMRNDLTDMISGHSELIAGIDPSQGLKYSATVNSSASTLYKSALENKLTIYQTQKIATADAVLAKKPAEFKSILQQKDADIESLLGQLTVAAVEAKDFAINTGSKAYGEKQSAEIEKMVSKAKIGTLLDHMKQPRNARAALAGDFGERYSALYAVLNDDEKVALRKAYIDQEKETLSLYEAQDRQDERIRNDKIEMLTPEIMQAIRNRNFEAAEPLVKMLERLAPEKADKYYKVMKTDGGVDSADRISELDRMAMRRELTEDDILDAFTDREITRATMDRLFGDLTTQRDKRFNRAVEVLSDFYGKPELLARGKQGKAPENLRQFAKHRSDMILKIDADPAFDPIAYAQQIIEKEKTDPTVNPDKQAAIKAIQKNVNKASKSLFGKTITDLDELIAAAQALQSSPVKPGFFGGGTDMATLAELLKDARELQELRGE